MKTRTDNDIELYTRQFANSKRLVGQTIREILFYLEPSDIDYTEQPNSYGKSLLNGIDILTETETFSIGNRYTNLGYGLSIDKEHTLNVEYFDQEKTPTNYPTKLTGKIIRQVKIYWKNIPFEGMTGLYPQEIEILTDNDYLLLSSIEVNNGQVNTEFTNELLVIENSEISRQLNLGEFGLGEEDRKLYRNIEELIENEKKNGL